MFPPPSQDRILCLLSITQCPPSPTLALVAPNSLPLFLLCTGERVVQDGVRVAAAVNSSLTVYSTSRGYKNMVLTRHSSEKTSQARQGRDDHQTAKDK